MKSTKCSGHIHSSRTLCNKCAGVEPKAFEPEPSKIRGATIEGVWVSANERRRRAGMAEVMGILADIPQSNKAPAP